MKIEPELVAKASTMLMASALGVQKVLPATPISLTEIALAMGGGAAGGLLLLRTADPKKVMTLLDRAYTILFSAIIGAMLGPGVTNWATIAFDWIGEGVYENLAGGLVTGAIVPVGFGVIVAVLRAGQHDPKGVLDYLVKLWRALRGLE